MRRDGTWPGTFVKRKEEVALRDSPVSSVAGANGRRLPRPPTKCSAADRSRSKFLSERGDESTKTCASCFSARPASVAQLKSPERRHDLRLRHARGADLSFAMEYVEGVTVRDICQRAEPRFSLLRGAAHLDPAPGCARGSRTNDRSSHRDVKPSNMMRTPDGAS